MFYYSTKLNNQKSVTMQPHKSGKVKGNSFTIVLRMFFRYSECDALLPDLLSDGRSFKLTAPPYNSVTAHCVSFEIVSITMKRMNELIFGVSGILHSILWY
jgi:hypothetical protein